MNPPARGPVAADGGSPSVHSTRMDLNYRWQRHIYDLTRRYYLFGRDRLLDVLQPQPGECILEAGCGTARNLLALAKRQPPARLFGLDASSLMLATAAARVAHAGVSEQIALRCELAEHLHYQRTFELPMPFDAVFFSYALSMIPPWRSALAAGWENLRRGGRLLAVDFWDAARLPSWCRSLLHHWLGCFHTFPQPGIIPFVENLPGGGPVRIETVGPRYAFLISRVKL